MLGTPPAFILSQDRTLILNVKAEAFKFFPIQNSLSFVLSVVLLRINSRDLFDRLTIAGLWKFFRIFRVCVLIDLWFSRFVVLSSRDSLYILSNRFACVKHFFRNFWFIRKQNTSFESLFSGDEKIFYHRALSLSTRIFISSRFFSIWRKSSAE